MGVMRQQLEDVLASNVLGLRAVVNLVYGIHTLKNPGTGRQKASALLQFCAGSHTSTNA